MKLKKALLVMSLGVATLLSSSVPVFAGNVMHVQSEEENIEVASSTYAIVNRNTKMYSGRYSGSVVCSLPQGAIVEIRSTHSVRCRVKYNHEIGYVDTACLNFQ